VLILLACAGPPEPPAEPVPAGPVPVATSPAPVMSAPPREAPADAPRVTHAELVAPDGAVVSAQVRLARPGAPALILLADAGRAASDWPPVLVAELDARGLSSCLAEPQGDEPEVREAEACASRLRAAGAGALAVLGDGRGASAAARWAAAGGDPAWIGLIALRDPSVPLDGLVGVPVVFFSAVDALDVPNAHKGRSDQWTFHAYPAPGEGPLLARKPVAVGDVLQGVLRAVRPR